MEDLVEVRSERTRIGELSHSDRIIGCMNETKEHWKNRTVFGPGEDTPQPHSRCRLYRNLTIKALYGYLERRKPKFSGTSTTGIPYQIHEIPKNERRIVGSLLGEACEKYYRIYMQTEDGVVIHNCGECTESGRLTKILNLPTPQTQTSEVAT